MKVKQLETWGEIVDYVVRRAKPVYVLFPEGENMLLANNREYSEVSQCFQDGAPFVVMEADYDEERS